MLEGTHALTLGLSDRKVETEMPNCAAMVVHVSPETAVYCCEHEPLGGGGGDPLPSELMDHCMPCARPMLVGPMSASKALVEKSRSSKAHASQRSVMVTWIERPWSA